MCPHGGHLTGCRLDVGPKMELTPSTLGDVLKYTTISVPYVLLSEPVSRFHRAVLRTEREAVCSGSSTAPGLGLAPVACLCRCAGQEPCGDWGQKHHENTRDRTPQASRDLFLLAAMDR